MAYTEADLTRLKRLYASGIRTTEIAGERITYHSMAEMREAIRAVEAELAQTSGVAARGPVRIVRVYSEKGW